jgi:excinuclease ABC subunit A
MLFVRYVLLPAMKQRLAESFETALRIADGRAIALEMDTGARAPVHQQPLRLPGVQPLRCANSSRACSRSTTRWAPARGCDGLGTVQFFDPSARSCLPELWAWPRARSSGWDRRNQLLLHSMLQSLAALLRLRHRHAVRAAARRCAAGDPARLGRAASVRPSST